MTKIVVIAGTSLAQSYCGALAEAYRRGAQAGGHTVEFFDLGAISFDPILREGYRRPQSLEPDLATARQAMGEADHLVFLFPLWCGDMPSILKGFIERVLQPDLLASHTPEGKKLWPPFKGKSARIIMTMGMPGWFYRWYYGAHALKLIRRNILNFVGVSPVRSTIFGMVEAAGDEKRHAWLRDVEALGRNAA